MSRSELDDLEQRPRRYWTVDGIPELVMGGIWIVWGAAVLIGESLPRGPGFVAFWLTVPAVLALSGFWSRWLVTRLKERLTYPRTGYVDYPEPAPRTRLMVAGVAIAAAATMAGLLLTGRAAGAENVAAPAVGVVLSLAFLVISVRQRAPHLLALAGVALALGIAGGVVKLGWSSLNWLFVGLGAGRRGHRRLSIAPLSEGQPEVTDLDRVIHEPARLRIVALLVGAREPTSSGCCARAA